MAQKFWVNPATKFAHNNGAVGYGPGGSMDCLGPWAKVKNCPVECEGVEGLRLTCYATGYAETFFSIPACTRYKGQHIGGFFRSDEEGPKFRVYDRFKAKLQALHTGAEVPEVPTLTEWQARAEAEKPRYL